MLYYDRIDFSEGVDANKKSTSRKCIICHYLYFFYIKCLIFNQLSAMVFMMSLNFVVALLMKLAKVMP